MRFSSVQVLHPRFLELVGVLAVDARLLHLEVHLLELLVGDFEEVTERGAGHDGSLRWVQRVLRPIWHTHKASSRLANPKSGEN